MNCQIIKNIHWLAVLFTLVTYFALGAWWYSKVLFVKKWLAVTNIDTSDPHARKGMAAIMGASFILILLPV
jgi:hypothetical protein